MRHFTIIGVLLVSSIFATIYVTKKVLYLMNFTGSFLDPIWCRKANFSSSRKIHQSGISNLQSGRFGAWKRSTQRHTIRIPPNQSVASPNSSVLFYNLLFTNRGQVWIDEVEIVPQKAGTFIDTSALLKYKLEGSTGKELEILSNNAGMLMVLEATDYQVMFDSHYKAWAFYFSIILGMAGFSYAKYNKATSQLQQHHRH